MSENVDLRYLRVAVVPTETGNGIDQRSTVEEILACEETQLFSVPDYFKAQNDEDLPLLHWSFLIDINKNADLTGSNVDGIDYNSEDTKAGKIRRIQKVVEEWGNFSIADVEGDSSPVYKSMGKNNFCLVERIERSGVGITQYVHDSEVDDFDLDYSELEDDLIDEILTIAENYDVAQYKLHEGCH
jgi:hypothetical protein